MNYERSEDRAKKGMGEGSEQRATAQCQVLGRPGYLAGYSPSIFPGKVREILFRSDKCSPGPKPPMAQTENMRATQLWFESEIESPTPHSSAAPTSVPQICPEADPEV